MKQREVIVDRTVDGKEVAVPAFSLHYYPSGQTVEQPLPGDFLLTHGAAWTSRLIRVGESIRYRGNRAKFAHWSHSALFVSEDGEIIEALGGGVQKRNVSEYKETEYFVVRLSEVTMQNRNFEVAFATHCLHEHYGFLTIVSLTITLLTAAKIFFGVSGQRTCSGLVAQALERTGAIFEYDSWLMMPADLAEQFKVTPVPGGSKGVVPRARQGVTQRSS